MTIASGNSGRAVTATTHTGNIAQAKPMKLRPVEVKTSKLVRLETGSSVDAEFERQTEA